MNDKQTYFMHIFFALSIYNINFFNCWKSLELFLMMKYFIFFFKKNKKKQIKKKKKKKKLNQDKYIFKEEKLNKEIPT